MVSWNQERNEQPASSCDSSVTQQVNYKLCGREYENSARNEDLAVGNQRLDHLVGSREPSHSTRKRQDQIRNRPDEAICEQCRDARNDMLREQFEEIDFDPLGRGECVCSTGCERGVSHGCAELSSGMLTTPPNKRGGGRAMRAHPLHSRAQTDVCATSSSLQERIHRLAECLLLFVRQHVARLRDHLLLRARDPFRELLRIERRNQLVRGAPQDQRR